MDTVEDPAVKGILSDLCKAISLINENQKTIVSPASAPVSAAAAVANESSGMVSLGTIPKRNRIAIESSDTGTSRFGPNTDKTVPVPVPVPETEKISPEVAKFREVVRKAECSTLIFNLNMGRIPIMNTATMSNKATLALAAMAAENEERPGSIPEEDTVATIDDVLSMATKIDFYGRKTKTYTNARDKKSGSFCTIPVLYEFSDKDSRFEAETYLRKKCGAHCSTPYPTILRECIRQAVDAVKADFPNDQVKVTVDANNFCLRAARRAPVEGNAKKNRWQYADKTVPLPDLALDVDAKKVPDGFKLALPVRNEVEVMEAAEAAASEAVL
jgi:hypothetical protein